MDGRDDVRLTNLDQPLFDGADATKGDLVDYLDAVAEQLLGELRDRPLSVMRALRGRRPFMQKNVPRYAPPWIETVSIWAEASSAKSPTRSATTARRCAGSPTSARSSTTRRSRGSTATAGRRPRQTHLVLDLDPPAGAPFAVGRPPPSSCVRRLPTPASPAR